MTNGSSSIQNQLIIKPQENVSEDILYSSSCHISMNKSNIVISQEKEKHLSKWCIDDFKIGRQLGEGSYSTVILVEEKKTNFLCALKVIKKSLIQKYHQEHQLIRELEIHMRLFHKHILRMYDFFYDSNRIYVILEYASNHTLASYLKFHKYLDNIQTATFIYQISDALNYCHRLKIMHRDLKPENILLGQFNEIKLADFGLALHCPSSRRIQYIGTMDYMAPEVIENENLLLAMPYEESIDIWSLGIITYELLVGITPFYDLNINITKKRILSCDYILPDNLHQDAKNFIKYLLKYNKNERLKLLNIFQHNFIEKFAKKNFLNETFHYFNSIHQNNNVR